MFVYPSMYEGFGLPVIEAMACGAPVITGRAAALVGGRRRRRRSTSTRSSRTRWAARWSRSPRSRDRRRGACRPPASRGPRRSRGSAPRVRGWRSIATRRMAAGVRLLRVPSRQRGRGRRSPARRTRAATSSTDVLFGQAYFLRFDPKLWEARQPYAPLGALYAAACVRDARLRVALFDAMLAASEDEWADALDAHRPRFAVIYEDNFNYLSKMCLLRMRAGRADDDRPGAGARHHDDRRRLGRHRSPGHLPRSRRRRGRRRRRRGDAGRAARHPGLPARRKRRGTAGGAEAGQRPLAAQPRRPQRPHAAARDHPRPRRAAAAGVGSRRRRPLPRDVARAPRLLLDERGDDARLPVPLQLVREADLRPALHRAIARARGRGDGVAEADLPPRPPLDRRRHLRAEAGMDRALRDAGAASATPRFRSSACCAPIR